MKTSKPNDSQIASILKQAKSDIAVKNICGRVEIRELASSTWGVKHAKLMSSEMMQLCHLAQEKATLKQIAADLSLDTAMLRDALSKMNDPIPSGKVQNYLEGSIGAGSWSIMPLKGGHSVVSRRRKVQF